MKNLIIIIGTIMLGVLIVNTMILGDGEDSLRGAAGSLVSRGTSVIRTISPGEGE